MQTKFLSASAFVASVSAASSNYLGFNSGSTHGSGAAKVKSDFVSEFNTAAKLAGAPGTFNSIRLYTNIQGGTTADPIQAFDAAIQTKTNLLLGVWASGVTNIDNELNALASGLDNLGDDLANLVIGISIGSEDLYRAGATGVANEAGVGNGPEAIVGFIDDFKKKFKGTALADTPIGHVDTWDAWTNGSNSAVIDAVDWLGVDEYPYYQTGDDNTIDNAPSLFEQAYDATVGVANGKTVWVTETGWPYGGMTWDKAVSSLPNAKQYWDEVGCAKLFNKVPTFWYNLVEDNATNNQTFAIATDEGSPRFNLTCPANSTEDSANSTSTSTSSAGGSESTGSSNSTSTGSGSSATSTSGSSSSGSGSGTSSGSSSSASSSSGVATSGVSSNMGSSVFAAVAFIGAAFALF